VQIIRSRKNIYGLTEFFRRRTTIKNKRPKIDDEVGSLFPPSIIISVDLF